MWKGIAGVVLMLAASVVRAYQYAFPSTSTCTSKGVKLPRIPKTSSRWLSAAKTYSYGHRSKNIEEDHDLNLGLGQEKVLYVDDDLIVVDKPTKAQSAPGYVSQDSVATRLAKIFGIQRVDKMIVHRLDYSTSGLIVYARNDYALSHLHAQFREKGDVKKTYVALVDGVIESDLGEIDAPLGKDIKRGSPFCCVDYTHGKKSITQWEVRQRSEDSTLVQLFPITGRTHQLRIHMASLGHAILGDLFYAPKHVFERSDRLLLHAESLTFAHPRTKELISFHAKCPFDIDDY